jgi:hypothetical protein
MILFLFCPVSNLKALLFIVFIISFLVFNILVAFNGVALAHIEFIFFCSVMNIPTCRFVISVAQCLDFLAHFGPDFFLALLGSR